MPEGPEVRRCADTLGTIITKETIVEAKAVSGKLLRLGVAGLDTLNLPARVEHVGAKGKVIFIRLSPQESDSRWIVSTLGMSGWWYPPASQLDPQVAERKAYYNGASVRIADVIEKAEKHVRFTIKTENGKIANYIDPRNFGNLKVNDSTATTGLLASLGVDFLNGPRDPTEALLAIKRAKKKEIGSALLDQSLLAGLGNIYRAEVLYLAGINPFRRANELSDFELSRIVDCAYLILHIAYANHGMMAYPIKLLRMNLGRVPGVMAKLDKMGDGVVRHLVYGCRTDIFGHKVEVDRARGRAIWYVKEMQS